MPSFLSLGQHLAKLPAQSATRLSSSFRRLLPRATPQPLLLKELKSIVSSGDFARAAHRLTGVANREFHLVDAMQKGFSPASPVILNDGGLHELGLQIQKCQAYIAHMWSSAGRDLLSAQLKTLHNAQVAATAHWNLKYREAEASGNSLNAIFAGAVLGSPAQPATPRTAHSPVDVTLTELVRAHRTTAQLNRQTLDQIEQHLHDRYQLDEALECKHDASAEALVTSCGGNLHAARADVVRAMRASGQVSSLDVRDDLERELSVQKGKLDAAIEHWREIADDPRSHQTPSRQDLAQQWLGDACEEEGPRKVVSWNDLVEAHASVAVKVRHAQQRTSDVQWHQVVPLPQSRPAPRPTTL